MDGLISKIPDVNPLKGSMLTGGFNLLGGGLSALSQYLTNQQNIEAQWEMWNANNEYNKPINQMARFKEAGLNPHLIYGQMSNAPAVNVGVAQPPNFDFLGQAAQTAFNAYNVRESTPFDLAIKTAQQILTSFQGFIAQEDYKKRGDMNDAQYNNVVAATEKALQDIEIGKEEKAIKQVEKIAAENDIKFDFHSTITELFPNMGPGMRLLIVGLEAIFNFLGVPLQAILSKRLGGK